MSYSTCVRGGGLCTGCMACKDDTYVCDDCGKEIDPDDLYDVYGDLLCRDCLLERFRA